MTTQNHETLQASIMTAGVVSMYAMLVYVVYALSAVAHHVWL